MLNIVIGSHVWVEDKDLSWVDGEVFRIDGQNAHVRTTKGKTVCIAMVTKSAKSYCFVYFLAFQFLVQSAFTTLLCVSPPDACHSSGILCLFWKKTSALCIAEKT
jgi:myosin-5